MYCLYRVFTLDQLTNNVALHHEIDFAHKIDSLFVQSKSLLNNSLLQFDWDTEIQWPRKISGQITCQKSKENRRFL